MDGTLDPEETPGGGLTMIVTLPAYVPDPVLMSHLDSERERQVQ